jgi:hypothetical protein
MLGRDHYVQLESSAGNRLKKRIRRERVGLSPLVILGVVTTLFVYLHDDCVEKPKGENANDIGPRFFLAGGCFFP